MNTLRTAIFSACIIGVISCMVDIAAPNGNLKNQVKTITAIILILAVFIPFVNSDFDFDFNGGESLTESDEYEAMTEEFKDIYLGMTSDKMAEAIENLIKQQGIDTKKVVIESNYDEYNSLEAEKVTVTAENLSNADKEKITKIINDNLPEAEVEYVELSNDGN